MNKFLIFILIIFAGIGASYYWQTKLCYRVKTYDIGGFDARFNISREKFLATIKEAEAIWEKGAGQDLFNYQPGGKLKISLIFDEREANTIAANQSKEKIETTRADYDELLSQYKALETSYKSDLIAYNHGMNQFESELNAYNARVAAANRKGGATPKEYAELEQERKRLEAAKAKLDIDREAVNEAATRLNLIAELLNEMAQKLNIDVDIFNQRFGTGKEFEQGQYSGKIDIFQFDSVSDLRMVIAHELGHALGIDHVENPTSVMYYLMEKQNLQNPSLSREDLTAFNERCEMKLPAFSNLYLLVQHILRFQY
jgi:hypothetical protein